MHNSLQNNQGNSDIDNPTYVNIFAKVFATHPNICSFIVIAIIGGLLTIGGVFLKKIISDFDQKINKLSEDYDKLVSKDSFNETNDRLSKVEDLLRENGEDIAALKGSNSNVKTYYSDNLSIKQYSSDPTHMYASIPIVTKNLLFKDSRGEEYKGSQLVNNMMVIAYSENDTDVYFLGRYNEYYHWDGYCIVNAYNSKGELLSVCESEFDDGKRLNYISFYRDSDNYVYTNRIVKRKSNSGISIILSGEGHKKRTFFSSQVGINDILHVSDYINSLDERHIVSIYVGDTSHGKYNDLSGNAYHVELDTDGKVILLYHGKVKDGFADDDTGKAYSIAYSKRAKKYYYNYNTNFKNGFAENKSTKPLSKKKLKELTDNININGFELKWKY